MQSAAVRAPMSSLSAPDRVLHVRPSREVGLQAGAVHTAARELALCGLSAATRAAASDFIASQEQAAVGSQRLDQAAMD